MPSYSDFKPIRGNPTLNRAGNLTDGLVGAWIFNETGSRVIRNYANISGYGDATMQTAPTWSGSHWGSALRFVSGSSDYAVIPNYVEFRPGFPFSIAARIMIPTGASAVNCVWTNDDAMNKFSGISLITNDTGGVFVRTGDNAGTGSTHRRDYPLLDSIGNDTWASVAFNVYSKESFKGYFNGTLSTGSVGGTASTLTYNTTGTVQGSMGREDVSTSSAEYYSDHVVDYIYFWGGRSLSDGAALQLAQNPYRLFESRSRAMFFVTAPVTGWSHKINGVSNAAISKICGVSKAGISKVCGV